MFGSITSQIVEIIRFPSGNHAEIPNVRRSATPRIDDILYLIGASCRGTYHTMYGDEELGRDQDTLILGSGDEGGCFNLPDGDNGDKRLKVNWKQLCPGYRLTKDNQSGRTCHHCADDKVWALLSSLHDCDAVPSHIN